MKKLIFLLLCLMPLIPRADDLPDLGDVALATVTPEVEREIGEQSMYEIRADKTYLGDAEINDYLTRLGYQLVANSKEPGLPFEFFALSDNEINAFSLPGGFVGVNTGLILIAQSESELAAVLSHEISHVTQHHIARMIAGQKVDTIASAAAIAVAILAARSTPQASQAVLVGAEAGAIQRQLNFTRASERVSDMANRLQDVPYRLVPDSLGFHLVQAKIAATLTPTQDAIKSFTEALGPRKYGNQTAQRYGLVVALLRAKQPARAAQEFAPLAKLSAQEPMIATLDGRVRRANTSPDVIGFYRTAMQNFPQYRALSYDYAELLLQDGKYDDVLKLLNEQVINHPDDPRLYELQARAFDALRRRQEEHHALAYMYASRGNLGAAIEQLELAKRAGTDYYETSTIESELKEFREIAAAHTKH
jgi:predicted Zn-dependent protease